VNKGIALKNLGKKEEAIEAYDQAIKINPNCMGLQYRYYHDLHLLLLLCFGVECKDFQRSPRAAKGTRSRKGKAR